MRLSTRLLLIVLGCLVPVVGAQIYMQLDLYGQHQRQVGRLALRQAELANSDVSSIVEGARQIAVAAGAFPEVRDLTPDCDDRLASLERNLPSYRFFALADMSGRVVCASSPALRGTPAWTGSAPGDAEQEVGYYSSIPAIEGPFIPIYVRMPVGGRTMIAALDLQWLSRHLQESQTEHPLSPPNAALILADRRGTVIARFPESERWIGHGLPDGLTPLLGEPNPGTKIVTDEDGRRELAAFVGANVPPVGVVAIDTLSLSDLLDQSNEALQRNILLIVSVALFALILAWLIGRRFIDRPTDTLIAAVRRWGRGDLRVRAPTGEGQGEFGELARSFNAMASSLETRERERRLQADLAEAQVAQRSRELSESNNRLQVEIAERERAEAALMGAQKMHAVGQLAGSIAHDFNNMLATVLGSLELMERRVTQDAQRWTAADADRLRTLIDRASGAVQRGAQLTSGLLAFARHQGAAAQTINLNQLIGDLTTLATSALGRRIRLIADLDEAPWSVLVDPGRVETAILNLCLNARDAMPEGGTLTIRTTNLMVTADYDSLPELPPGPYVCVEVADTGAGMSPEAQRRAFDPFFTTKANAGCGLGLSQVRNMVRQAGGAVRVQSTPGQGTAVRLLLPRAAGDAIAPKAAWTPTPSRRAVKPMTVLMVDDDAAVRQVTVEMLRDLGCNVLQAPSAADALSLLSARESRPDIILVDYAMPGMNGLGLARRLREDGLRLPIAMVTGYAELADLETGETPLDGLLRKPFTIQELQALLLRLGELTHPPSNVIRLHVPQRG